MRIAFGMSAGVPDFDQARMKTGARWGIDEIPDGESFDELVERDIWWICRKVRMCDDRNS